MIISNRRTLSVPMRFIAETKLAQCFNAGIINFWRFTSSSFLAIILKSICSDVCQNARSVRKVKIPGIVWTNWCFHKVGGSILSLKSWVWTTVPLKLYAYKSNTTTENIYWNNLDWSCMTDSDGQIQIMIWFKSWLNHWWWFDLWFAHHCWPRK